MSEYRPTTGDRVRVVLEGEVRKTRGPHESIAIGTSNDDYSHWVRTGLSGVVSIKKVEPPVVTFKPGDTVRNRATGALLTLGHKGFLNHRTTNFHRYGKADPTIVGNGGKYLSLDQFTSDKYELVPL